MIVIAAVDASVLVAVPLLVGLLAVLVLTELGHEGHTEGLEIG
jgi:hypothetical protein